MNDEKHLGADATAGQAVHAPQLPHVAAWVALRELRDDVGGLFVDAVDDEKYPRGSSFQRGRNAALQSCLNLIDSRLRMIAKVETGNPVSVSEIGSLRSEAPK